MDTNTQQGPLSGLRVLELGQLVAGPTAGQMLAYYGADVVKIEPPGKGDPLRTWRELDEQGESYWWHSMARNKRSVAVNLSSESGQNLVRELIQRCDVVVENFRAGKMEAWGLGPEVFTDSNPALVYTRVSGYGQTGPYKDRLGFASACEGVAGFRYVNGFPGQVPVRPNLSLGDTLAGMHAVIGTLLALCARERLHVGGQSVDVSIVESVFNMMEGVYPEYAGAGVQREPSGATLTGIVPTNTYRCVDGRFVVIGGNGDSIFKRLMRLIEREDLADDARLSHNPGRVEHQRLIDGALQAWTGQLNSNEVLERLAASEVPAGPINSISDIAQDPHFQARGSFESVKVRGQERWIPALHPKLSKTPGGSSSAGPSLGQHTDEVLTEWLDAEPEALATWRNSKAIE
jgi:crotonobetainyl-CoA:carnitine CoA-transferase CaiB-like acyl-CoA transferase